MHSRVVANASVDVPLHIGLLVFLLAAGCQSCHETSDPVEGPSARLPDAIVSMGMRHGLDIDVRDEREEGMSGDARTISLPSGDRTSFWSDYFALAKSSPCTFGWISTDRQVPPSKPAIVRLTSGDSGVVRVLANDRFCLVFDRDAAVRHVAKSSSQPTADPLVGVRLMWLPDPESVVLAIKFHPGVPLVKQVGNPLVRGGASTLGNVEQGRLPQDYGGTIELTLGKNWNEVEVPVPQQPKLTSKPLGFTAPDGQRVIIHSFETTTEEWRGYEVYELKFSFPDLELGFPIAGCAFVDGNGQRHKPTSYGCHIESGGHPEFTMQIRTSSMSSAPTRVVVPVPSRISTMIIDIKDMKDVW